VRFQAAQALVGQRRGDLQPLLDREVRPVLRVEAARRRAEEPDAGRELQLQLEAVEVIEQLLPAAPRGLGAKIGKRHREPLVLEDPSAPARAGSAAAGSIRQRPPGPVMVRPCTRCS
jgi:hypothetical protein